MEFTGRKLETQYQPEIQESGLRKVKEPWDTGKLVSGIFWLVTAPTDLKRQPCLWLLPTPWVNANGPFFVFFPQDLKSLVREYDGLSSRMCTCHSSQARGRQGNWLQQWVLWYITSASLQGPIPHPPAAGDVACWCLTHDSLPRNHRPLGGNASPKGTPSTRGSLYPMPVDTRTQKSGPCASIWDISEGPSQTQSSLWRWLTCLCKQQFNIILFSSLPYRHCSSECTPVNHTQANKCLSQDMSSIYDGRPHFPRKNCP